MHAHFNTTFFAHMIAIGADSKANQIEPILLYLFIYQTSWGEAQHEYSAELLQKQW